MENRKELVKHFFLSVPVWYPSLLCWQKLLYGLFPATPPFPPPGVGSYHFIHCLERIAGKVMSWMTNPNRLLCSRLTRPKVAGNWNCLAGIVCISLSDIQLIEVLFVW